MMIMITLIVQRLDVLMVIPWLQKLCIIILLKALKKNRKLTYISCPICQIELDWDQCTQIADMSRREYENWKRMIEKRTEPESKPCPSCGAGICRKKRVVCFRIYCCLCKRPDRCWHCLQEWNNVGMIDCGNDNCTLIKDINQYLSEFPLFAPSYLNNGITSNNILISGYIKLKNISMKVPKEIIDLINVFIPQIMIPNTRACPMCLTFMEQIDECKHLTCAGCGGKFCFVCLGKYDERNKKWCCNEWTKNTTNNTQYDSKCKPAPIQ
eukprot:241207_1